MVVITLGAMKIALLVLLALPAAAALKCWETSKTDLATINELTCMEGSTFCGTAYQGNTPFEVLSCGPPPESGLKCEDNSFPMERRPMYCCTTDLCSTSSSGYPVSIMMGIMAVGAAAWIRT
ncbi:hypothetical protein PMAYCL1PPCAC_11191 [Pristionchus mayeri]|uniref:UPAR/Ly6 domain-containing protein n=1 Tax=Pristionchus mayeri TaxID=1317129 RepID=A0AAN4ZHP0_9BILA|nr:hypothetical protein PMAYCL1PPCAC_11191 [Pristionchus mayeri]